MTRIAVAIAILLSVRQGMADEVMFNPNALEIDNPSSTRVDLSQFSTKGGQVPDIYRVDIYVNGEEVDTRDVNFVLGTGGKLFPQLTPAQLEQWGVMLNSAPALLGIPKDTKITDLSRYIPQAGTDFDFSRQALNISVPQASMRPSAQGAVDPKYWDEGIPAMMLNYSFTGANTWQDGSDGTNDSYFLNLRSGVNLGAWRLRNYSTWSYSKASDDNDSQGNSGSDSRWDSINTYVQRDLPPIKGQFTAGESYTPSDVFDSIQFKGAQVASDDNMLPDSLRGFAPTVRGIANSNAQVTVKQNGSVIYQTYVPPGAFTISDLYPTSSSGDLLVTIKEANGSERTFVQPFSNVPIMQREGRLKYAMTVGEYRSQNEGGDEPILGQATLVYGLPHDMTVYGGFQTSDNYNAMALGMGFGLGDLGSISLDATQAYTTLDDAVQGGNQSRDGQSYRFQYSKDIAATDSTVTLAGYRYSTEGFYTFQEAMDYRDYDDGDYVDAHNNKRSKIQLDLTQSLMGGDWGSMSFSGYQQDYWNEDGYERNLSVSYSNSILDGITWTLMYTYTEYADSYEENNQQLALNVSVPLSKWLPGAYMSNSMTNDMHGKTHNQIGLNGTALEDNNLSYSVAQGYGNRDEGYSGLVSGDYKGTYGEVNAGYNYNDDSRQVNYGAQGSVLVHEHGVTLGQPMSGDMSSVALVEAPGADGVKVQNGTGVKTDWRGYTIVPYLSPYKRSRIALDPGSLGDDVDLKENVTSVVPTAGAVVRANFKTNVGNRVLMTLLQGGNAVPFGALVSIDGSDSDNTGIVGESGQVYLSGVPQSGRLTVKWGNDGSQQCHADFGLAAQAGNRKEHAIGVQQINVDCK
ncbi:fimbria/pilus outer membrane usher protein [Citrobacter amalonaticus]|uniref:fimbria/pilus outer membrane usher protein n=1 Tax=Citrobacter amalonaticus TaxID=35703 RepID=UPI00300CC3DB